MKELFITYLQAGFFGSIMILLVVLLRCFLKKAPGKYLCILWILVIVRLLLPFNLESRLSLQPRYDFWDPQFQQTEYDHDINSKPEWTPLEEHEQDNAVEDEIPTALSKKIDYVQILSVAWLSMGAVLLAYTVAAYAFLRFRVRDAVKSGKGVLESDRIRGAFALGYICPRIYLPVGLSDIDRDLIIAHERTHIARGDNWLKLAGFFCCCVHWYNPLVWISYVLLCRDIEIACDERVVSGMDLDQRKMYSMALLNCGKRMSGYMVCPVAFGEVNLKQRIKNVLSYRRPELWVSIATVVLVGIVAVCFLTNPVQAEDLPTDPTETINEHTYDEGVMTLAPACGQEGLMTYTCTKCGEKKTESISALPHLFGEGVKTELPTCSESGVITYTCVRCGAVKTEVSNTLAHKFGELTVSKEPTCKEEGELLAECILCGCIQVVDTVPKTQEHQYENRVIRKPTCVDRGEGADVCTVCGHSVSCDYELTDHAYGNAVVTKEATCAEKGLKTYTCSVCKDEYTKPIDKKDHIWDEGPCNAPGTCTVCGTTGSTNRGHDYYQEKESTPSNMYPGQKTYRCSRCYASYTTLYNEFGEYDYSKAVSAGKKRAKELGFGAETSQPDDKYHVKYKMRELPYWYTHNGRNPTESLKAEVVRLVNEVCEAFPHDNHADYYVVVTINFGLDWIQSPYFYLRAYIYSYN